MDSSPPGFSVHGILQARMLKWVAMSSSRRSIQPRNQTSISCVSCIAGRFFTAEPPGKHPQRGELIVARSIDISFTIKWNKPTNYTHIQKISWRKKVTASPMPCTSVQFSSVAQLCPTLCDSMNRSMPGLPVHHQLPEFTQTHVHRVGDAIQPSHPLLSPSPPAPIPPSIRVFYSESTLCMRWPKYWSFSFSISPSNEYPGLISFRMDWLDLLEVQGTLKSLLQHHSSKASILRRSAFFTVQLSHPYMTTGKP